MKKELLIVLVLLALGWPGRTEPQPVELELRKETEAAKVRAVVEQAARVREEVSERWRLPSLTDDATIRVQATVLLSGAIVNPQLSIEGLEGEDLDKTRRSLEEAIGRTVASVPPGPVAFTVHVRANAHLPRCFPLKVHVAGYLKDSTDAVPRTSIAAIEQGMFQWERLLTNYSDKAATPPFVMVDRPDQADVRVEAYADYSEYSSYLGGDDDPQAVVRVPLKQLQQGLFFSGLSWRQPRSVTEQSMFQLGRLLGLELSDEPGNVLYPGEPGRLALRSIRRAGVESFSVRQLGGGHFLLDRERAERSLNETQLKKAGALLRERACLPLSTVQTENR